MHIERVSLYRVLKQFKSYKNKSAFYKDYEYWFRGHRLTEIDLIRNKITFSYGLTYYFTREDYHSVFFTIKID